MWWYFYKATPSLYAPSSSSSSSSRGTRPRAQFLLNVSSLHVGHASIRRSSSGSRRQGGVMSMVVSVSVNDGDKNVMTL